MQYLEIGQIVNTFGIKGQVKVVPFTDDITRFDYLKKVYIVNKKLRKEVEVEDVKYHKDMVLLKFKGLEKIEDVEIYKNCYLEIDRKDAKPLEKGEYYIVDLIGLNVISDEGVILGKVDDIYNTGSNDIYVVKDELGKQLLLPGIKDVIKEVDLENQKIVVHLIEGLI
ncbi:MAG: 16S rRNA processing protein RimM [Clostridia bacterium]|nr:16S rRNA processing protein RimM [Clostridia bacterium]